MLRANNGHHIGRLGESPISSQSLDSDSNSDSPVDSHTQSRSVLNGFYRKAWDHTLNHRESSTQHRGHKNNKTTQKPPNIHNHPPIGRKEPSDSPPLRSSLGSEVDRENSEVVVHAAASSSGYKSEKRHHHRHHHHHKHRSHGGEDRHSRHHRY